MSVRVLNKKERYRKLKKIVESKGLYLEQKLFDWDGNGTALRSIDITKKETKKVKKGIPFINRRTEKENVKESIARFSKSSYKDQFLDDKWIIDVKSEEYVSVIKEIMTEIEKKIGVDVDIRVTSLSCKNLSRV